MHQRLSRPGVLLTAFALLASACGGTTATPSPAAPSQPAESASVAPSPSGPPTVPPGGPVDIRWYCCLGGGEAPEQKTVEDKVVADFNASHPNIHLTFEVVTYDQANGQWFWATQTTATRPNEADWADTQNLFGLGCISFAKPPSGSDVGANKDMQDCIFGGDVGEKDFILVLS